MKSLFYLVVFFIIAVAVTSCEKVIDVKTDTSPSQLVIEGNITNIRQQQTIKISRTVDYTNPNVYPAVRGALVNVKDNAGNSWNFTEETPGVYRSVSILGRPGRTYTLTVNVENNVYTASSTMPAQVRADSITLTDITFGSRTRKLVAVHYTDPKGVPNYYRYILRINGRQTNRVYVYDDRLKDGNLSKNELYPDTEDDDERNELKRGDVAEVEMQNIDKNIFNYWFTLRQQSRGGPGGGTTPGNPPSNINNGALGYFSAHTHQAISITVP
ncbi:DUF4249 domain-containing protein [uncultured Mucilaginibacter sp.]|uniref:DUF4249 domain-containing protein n=1 Tax=uncultured Mucilaginibacter sp. TaxID=797541 RepID=UPI0025DADEFD|nr:DUF4249 domain-containing protein [uncultured Mucilaginibacter sp.]